MENIFIYLPLILSIILGLAYYIVTKDNKGSIVAIVIASILFFTPIFIIIAAYLLYKYQL